MGFSISFYLFLCAIFNPMPVILVDNFHKAPDNIKSEVVQALSFFPELANTPITFKYTDKKGTSVMLAQPVFKSLLKNKDQREYVILIRKEFNIGGKTFNCSEIPSEILIGWLGHELGHIVDYKERSAVNLTFFGLRYLVFDKHIRAAERTADQIAVQNGMADYIVGTKEFILNHADLSSDYKDKIRKFYLSPEQIMELANKERPSG